MSEVVDVCPTMAPSEAPAEVPALVEQSTHRSRSMAPDGLAAAGTLLVRAEDAAALLSVGRSTLYELVWSGRLRPVHIGRCVRFVRAELEEFVAELAAGR